MFSNILVTFVFRNVEEAKDPLYLIWKHVEEKLLKTIYTYFNIRLLRQSVYEKGCVCLQTDAITS